MEQVLLGSVVVVATALVAIYTGAPRLLRILGFQPRTVRPARVAHGKRALPA